MRSVPILAPCSNRSGLRLPRAVACFAARIPTRCAACLVLLAMIFATAAPTPAAADFTICNYSGSRVGVSLGYKDSEGWVTEGWWNLSDRTCEVLLRGGLVARYYYVYAVDYDRGGEWTGQAFMCSRDKEFTIRGIDNCLARGYDRTGFYEVDTGEQRSWTMQLTNSGKVSDSPPPSPVEPPTTPLPKSEKSPIGTLKR
jgi:uncharacterized membrane protein